AAASVVPASGTARLLRADDAFVLENIALDIGNSRARGRVVIKGFERPSLGGTLSLDRAELPVLLALMIGRAGESAAAPWTDRPFGPAALENAGGMIEIESATLGLVNPFVANGARLKLRFADNEAAIEDFSGELAGGKLSGTVRFARANPLVVDGNFSLAGADVARLTAPGAARGGMRGRANLSLQFSAQGNAPAAVAANFAGRGNLALEGLEIDKLDPEALTKVAAANAPLSEAEATAELAFGLQKGPLRVAKVEMPILVTAGVARAGRTRVAAGPVEVTSEASLDLAKLDLEAAIGLQAAATAKNAARPEATIRWRGPLAEPQRRIDVGALLTALSQQAVDAEMRRIEGRPALPPAAPAMNAPLPKRRPAEIPPPVAADLPPLPPPVEVGPAPGSGRPRPNPSLQ
ncbi:MAG TPA: AsmA-like C-terminal region-containing protein, partial [Xanthobacteraceae bacterium]|nr:AsmA-like C-terminal region-containing protein [Xanthobacteraceae bacterium]